MQKAFDDTKLSIATDAMTAYPEHNQPFKIDTSTTHYQLWPCSMQKNNGIWRPVAFHSGN